MKYVAQYPAFQRDDHDAAVVLSLEIGGKHIGRTKFGNAVIEFTKELGYSRRQELSLWPLHASEEWTPFR